MKKSQFDYILCECSGIADPAALLQMFWLDSELESPVYLDGLIAVVDARHFSDYLKDPEIKEFVVRQIAFADRILLNKVDGVSALDIASLNSILQSLNQTADILVSQFSKVDLNKVLAIGAMDTIRQIAELKESQMHQLICTVVFHEENGVVDVNLLNKVLADLLWEPNHPDIFRLKGILNTTPQRSFLQGVKETFEIVEGSPWPDQQRYTKILVIGRNLDEIFLKRVFSTIFNSRQE